MSALPPVRELVNVFEVEEAARAILPAALFAELDPSPSRAAIDRITFRPRLMQDVTALDLSVELFGQKHFTPILIGPMAGLDRYRANAEAELRQGAAAAQAAVISATGGDWQIVEPGAGQPTQAKVLVVRHGDLASLRRLQATTQAALVVKGVFSVADAQAAIDAGAQGLIVSSYGVRTAAHSLEVLPAIVDKVAGRVPVLVDGGFRRGTDIAKAIALGARAVLIARPAVWGLAAYGADGVQQVVELLQSELARAVAMLGRPNLARLDRSALRLHRW